MSHVLIENSAIRFELYPKALSLRTVHALQCSLVDFVKMCDIFFLYNILEHRKSVYCKGMYQYMGNIMAMSERRVHSLTERHLGFINQCV